MHHVQQIVNCGWKAEKLSVNETGERKDNHHQINIPGQIKKTCVATIIKHGFYRKVTYGVIDFIGFYCAFLLQLQYSFFFLHFKTFIAFKFFTIHEH